MPESVAVVDDKEGEDGLVGRPIHALRGAVAHKWFRTPAVVTGASTPRGRLCGPAFRGCCRFRSYV